MTEADPDMTAAEQALGLLEGEERAAALRRVLAEPAFAAEVEHWRDRFAALFAAVPEAAPGDSLLPRIEASIAPAAPVVPLRRNWVWPSIAAVSSMAAALLLAVLLTMPGPQLVPDKPVAPQLAAAVVPTGPGEPMAAMYSPNTGELRLTAVAMADAAHSAELWVIGGDGVPHSLGLLRARGITAMTVGPADRPRLRAAAVLAVSIEPVGGSPTGLPTGPVVAKGVLAHT